MFIVVSGAIFLLSISALYLLLIFGKPLGFLTWGGRYSSTLPKEIKILTAISIPIQLFAVYVLLKLGNLFPSNDSILFIVFGYVFMFFFLINSVMNYFSESKYEKIVMTPVSMWIFLCFVYVLVAF